MAEPINFTLVTARLRALLAGKTHLIPAATMQLRIGANHQATILWWFGQGRGYATVWYDGEDCSVELSGTYYGALDSFCILAKIPPLDTRQPYAREYADEQRRVALAEQAAAKRAAKAAERAAEDAEEAPETAILAPLPPRRMVSQLECV